MKKKTLYKTGWLTALTIVIMMAGAITVKADLGKCTQEDIEGMSDAVINQNLEYDYNNDGVVNLADAGLFAKQCNEVPINEPTKKIGGNGIKVLPMEDGSTTYLFKAHAFQIKQGVLLTWTKGYWGSITYDNLLITIQDGTGVNVKVVEK